MTLTLYSVPLSRLTISMVFTSSPTKVSSAGPGAAVERDNRGDASRRSKQKERRGESSGTIISFNSSEWEQMEEENSVMRVTQAGE